MTSENTKMNTALSAKSVNCGGMVVDAKKLALSDEEFEKALTVSLRDWITHGVRDVWFKVNLGKSAFIPILVKHGFKFHHAKTSYAMLTRCLPVDQSNLLPQYPHTYIDSTHRKGEIFKRIKISAFIKLALTYASELARNECDIDNQPTNRNRLEAPDTYTKRCANILMGIGELNLENNRNKVHSSPTKPSRLMPYLLLDVRDKYDFSLCHIKTAKNYPSAMLSRSMGSEIEDLKLCKNSIGTIIILYDDDETIANHVATALVERGYENVFILTGGLKLALEICPHGLTSSCQISTPVHMLAHGIATITQKNAIKEQFSKEDISIIQYFIKAYPRAGNNPSSRSESSSQSRTRSAGTMYKNSLESSASTSRTYTSSKRECSRNNPSSCSASSQSRTRSAGKMCKNSLESPVSTSRTFTSSKRECSCNCSSVHQRHQSIHHQSSKQPHSHSNSTRNTGLIHSNKLQPRSLASNALHWCSRNNHRYFWRMASKDTKLNTALPAKSDIYKGMIVDAKELVLSDEEFEKALTVSLHDWLANGVRGVWFKVNLGNSSFIPILIKHGFIFHHAKTSYAMLTRWLPADQPNLLPQYPHTHIGVAGMVINDKRQVLTIQEKYHKNPHWKLPGGYSNPGEEFSDTAKREVFEETGIETEFLSVVSLRHHHQHIFNCSDIYVVCHLRPINEEIQASKEEISQCEWMDIETYRNHSEVSIFNKFVMDAFLKSEQLKCVIKATPVVSLQKDFVHNVYSIQSLERSDKD